MVAKKSVKNIAPSEKEKLVANPVSVALRGIILVIVWISGILVSLAVGFGMTSGTLIVPKVPQFILALAGWIVVVLTIFGAMLAITHAFTKSR